MSKAADPNQGAASERFQNGSTASLTAIRDVLEAVIHGGVELAPVLEVIAERSEALCGADYSSVYMRDGELFHLAAASGGTPEFRQFEREHPMAVSRETVAGRVALERRAVHIPDVTADPDCWWPDAQRLAGYRTVLGPPIELDGEVIGAIGVARNEVNPFSDRRSRRSRSSPARPASPFASRISCSRSKISSRRSNGSAPSWRYMRHMSLACSPAMMESHCSPGTAGRSRPSSATIGGSRRSRRRPSRKRSWGVLREYHGAIGALVVQSGGTVEHFAGDGLMVFFNDPSPLPTHRSVAIQTALAMQDRFALLADTWRKLGYELGLGIGVAAGYATIGRIGFEGRYDYGAVGKVVILASRLSEAAAPGEILVSQRLFAAMEEEFEAEEVEPLPLKGFSRPSRMHRIIRDRPRDFGAGRRLMESIGIARPRDAPILDARRRSRNAGT
jgi:Adenylate and Guanylate cyclase catalytic domain/GAF domain